MLEELKPTWNQLSLFGLVAPSVEASATYIHWIKLMSPKNLSALVLVLEKMLEIDLICSFELAVLVLSVTSGAVPSCAELLERFPKLDAMLINASGRLIKLPTMFHLKLAWKGVKSVLAYCKPPEVRGNEGTYARLMLRLYAPFIRFTTKAPLHAFLNSLPKPLLWDHLFTRMSIDIDDGDVMDLYLQAIHSDRNMSEGWLSLSQSALVLSRIFYLSASRALALTREKIANPEQDLSKPPTKAAKASKKGGKTKTNSNEFVLPPSHENHWLVCDLVWQTTTSSHNWASLRLIFATLSQEKKTIEAVEMAIEELSLTPSDSKRYHMKKLALFQFVCLLQYGAFMTPSAPLAIINSKPIMRFLANYGAETLDELESCLALEWACQDNLFCRKLIDFGFLAGWQRFATNRKVIPVLLAITPQQLLDNIPLMRTLIGDLLFVSNPYFLLLPHIGANGDTSFCQTLYELFEEGKGFPVDIIACCKHCHSLHIGAVSNPLDAPHPGISAPSMVNDFAKAARGPPSSHKTAGVTLTALLAHASASEVPGLLELFYSRIRHTVHWTSPQEMFEYFTRLIDLRSVSHIVQSEFLVKHFADRGLFELLVRRLQTHPDPTFWTSICTLLQKPASARLFVDYLAQQCPRPVNQAKSAEEDLESLGGVPEVSNDRTRLYVGPLDSEVPERSIQALLRGTTLESLKVHVTDDSAAGKRKRYTALDFYPASGHRLEKPLLRAIAVCGWSSHEFEAHQRPTQDGLTLLLEKVLDSLTLHARPRGPNHLAAMCEVATHLLGASDALLRSWQHSPYVLPILEFALTSPHEEEFIRKLAALIRKSVLPDRIEVLDYRTASTFPPTIAAILMRPPASL